MNKEEFDKRIDAIIEEIHQLAQEACPDATMFSVSWYSFKVPTVPDTDVSIYTPSVAHSVVHRRQTDNFGKHTWEWRIYAK